MEKCVSHSNFFCRYRWKLKGSETFFRLILSQKNWSVFHENNTQVYFSDVKILLLTGKDGKQWSSYICPFTRSTKFSWFLQSSGAPPNLVPAYYVFPFFSSDCVGHYLISSLSHKDNCRLRGRLDEVAVLSVISLSDDDFVVILGWKQLRMTTTKMYALTVSLKLGQFPRTTAFSKHLRTLRPVIYALLTMRPKKHC